MINKSDKNHTFDCFVVFYNGPLVQVGARTGGFFVFSAGMGRSLPVFTWVSVIVLSWFKLFLLFYYLVYISSHASQPGPLM